MPLNWSLEQTLKRDVKIKLHRKNMDFNVNLPQKFSNSQYAMTNQRHMDSTGHPGSHPSCRETPMSDGDS